MGPEATRGYFPGSVGMHNEAAQKPGVSYFSSTFFINSIVKLAGPLVGYANAVTKQ